MTFWIASFPLSTAQMLLHCWACRLSFNHPHVLRVVAEFLTANSPRPRGCFTAKRHLTLTQLAWRKTVHSLPHDSKFDFRPLFTYHEPTRGRVLVQLCAELVVFLGPISSRGHLTALISAFNIQVESPSQHRFSLQHSLSPCDHFLCHLIDSLVRQRRKHSFFLGRSQSQRTDFSGFPQLVDGAYLKQLFAFLTKQGSHAPPWLFRPFQRHHYRSLNISCTFPWNIHALPLFFSFCLTFLLWNDRSQRISAAWHISSFTQLHTETTLHPAPPLFCGSSPLVVFAPSTAAYPFRFAYRTVFAVFCVFSFVPCFFACQFSQNYPRHFPVRGHSYVVDLTFFRTWGLVCHSRQGISCARAPLRPRKWPRFGILHWKFTAWTPRFQRVEFCIASARTTLALSAVAPS